MTQLMQTGAIADIVIAVMIAEGILLLALRSRLRGFHAYDVIAMLGAGLFLVLALRSTLTGAAWPWTALCLAAAFVAHSLDVWRQLRSRL